MATKKAVKKVVKAKEPVKDLFLVVGGGLDIIIEATSEEQAMLGLSQMVTDDGADRYYNDNEYAIYKLVKRVRVSIEQPQPVVKLIPVKD